MRDRIAKIIGDSIAAKESLAAHAAGSIEEAAALSIASLKAGGKLLICGNGGSAADSQHMAAELVGRFKKERHAIAAIALTTNTSTITAIANDYSYEVTFSRQIEALGRAGDVAVGISTSGNSGNVIAAMRAAKRLGMKTIGLTGGDGGKLARECDVTIRAGTNDTPRIQESHLVVIHIVCELIENAFIRS